MEPNRRDTLKFWVSIGLAPLPMPLFAQGAGPLRIGVNLPLSGPISNIGQDILLGMETAVEQVNKEGGLGQRKIELVVRDDKGSPTQAVANVRELTGSGVNLIAGGLATNTLLAVVPALEEANAVQISTGGQALALTHEKFSRNMFRGLNNDITVFRAYAKLAAEFYPDVTSWTTLTYDLEATLTAWDYFKTAATEAYGRFGKKVTFTAPIVANLGASDEKNQLGITRPTSRRSACSGSAPAPAPPARSARASSHRSWPRSGRPENSAAAARARHRCRSIRRGHASSAPGR